MTPSGPHGKFSRREMIRIGAVGLGGLTTGLALPDLLHAEQSRGYASPAKSCIFIILSGGLTHIDSWDPKPLASAETRGPYKPIATQTPGVHLTDMFPEMAKRTNRFCLVRSMSHGDTVHVTAAHTMLTGQKDGRRTNDSPTMGAIIAKFRPAERTLPSHVWLHNMKTGTNKVPRYNSGLSKIGYAYAPLRIGHELDNPSAPEFRVKAFDPPGDLTPESLGQRGRPS